MPKDYGDVGSEDDDEIPHEADVEDVPSEPQVNGSAIAERGREPRAAAGQDDEGEEDDGDDHGDDEEEGEEYQVETIVKHKTYKGEVEYLIKWVGYPSDQNTWEPEDNLLPHSAGALSEYHQKIGGDPKLNKPLKKTKSMASLKKEESSDETPPTKRRKTEEDDGTYMPKKSNWDSEVEKVETIERDESGQLQVYLRFTNQKKTKVSMEKVKKHCPVPMLEFYEKHLKFKSGEPT